MGIISGFIEFLRWIGARNLLIIILGLSLFIIGRSIWSNKEAEQVPITSLFKNIEYVQELRLVTYYYDELLDVGTSDRLQNLVNQAEEDSIAAVQDLEGARFLRERSFKALTVAIERFETSKTFLSTDSTLNRLKSELQLADARFQQHNLSLFVRVAAQLRVDSTIYGKKVWDLYKDYEETNRAIENKTVRGKEKKAKKDTRKVQKDLVMSAFNSRKDSLKADISFREAVLKETENTLKESRQSFRRSRNEAQNAFGKAEKGVADAIKEVEDKSRHLAKARAVLRARNSGPDSLRNMPNLLVIASAEATGKVDLKQLRYDIIGADSISVTQMPQAEMDSIEIILPKEKRYLVGDEKPKVSGRKAETGIFFEVYRQLKEAIGEAKMRVKTRAIDAGIYEETSAMARQYVMDFGKSMGYRVGFADEMVPDAAQQAQITSDSIRQQASDIRDSIGMKEAIEEIGGQGQTDAGGTPGAASSN